MARSRFEFYHEVFNVIFIAYYTKTILTSLRFLNLKLTDEERRGNVTHVATKNVKVVFGFGPRPVFKFDRLD